MNTHTYIVLEVLPSTYTDIEARLIGAGVVRGARAKHDTSLLDMHGIALAKGGEPQSVHHPAHYTTHAIECIDICEWYGFNLGNAIKYIWRAEHKGKPLEDLRKALWYIDRELANHNGATAAGKLATAPYTTALNAEQIDTAITQFRDTPYYECMRELLTMEWFGNLPNVGRARAHLITLISEQEVTTT